MEWSPFNTVTLRQLRVFTSVARLLSYTRAAEELGCRQPTISALVTDLERATGLTLFEQWGKRLLLTDEGRQLYAHAQQVIAQADEARHVVATLRGTSAVPLPCLYLGADTTVGTYVLPSLLAAFQRQQPAVTFRLQIANRATVQAALLAAHLDLALAGRPPDVPQVVAEPFLENPLVAIASPSHPLVQEQAIPLARLAEEPFLLREEGSGTRAALEELFAEAGLPLHVSMVLGHVEAIKQAVAAGLGVSVLSALAIRREVRAGCLAVLAVEHFPIQRRWYITRLAGGDLSSAAQAFLAFLRERYQNSQDPVTP